jgi:hypothetical protein
MTSRQRLIGERAEKIMQMELEDHRGTDSGASSLRRQFSGLDT